MYLALPGPISPFSWLVGGRDAEYAGAFMEDLANRIENRIQMTTDGNTVYLQAVEDSFGGGIDYAMLIKQYGATDDPVSPERRYSPSEFVCAEQRTITGNPKSEDTTTSHAERLNLSFRMGMRRYTRLTNAFSKKFENHVHMVAIWVVSYNWIRIHSTLKVTPAMEAGLTERTWEWAEIVEAMDAATPAPKRGPYKKRAEISK